MPFVLRHGGWLCLGLSKPDQDTYVELPVPTISCSSCLTAHLLTGMWASVEARALGRGGISWVAEVTGLSRNTARSGLWELEAEEGARGCAAQGVVESG